MIQTVAELFGKITLIGPVVAAGLLMWTPAAEARVKQIVIDSTTSPATGPAGTGGITYESISGRAFGELDPNEPLNAIIQDIALAPTNAKGMVEYTATFRLDKPIDMSKSSGLMWQDAPNRRTRTFGSSYFGIAYGERNFGDVVLNVGWQGDNSGGTTQVFPNTTDYVIVPVATNPDGTPITGLVLGRIVNHSGPNSQTVNVYVNPVPYQPVTLDTTQATLNTRAHESMDGVVRGLGTVASSDWAWASCSATNPFPGTPSASQICLWNGFDPTLLYQVVFTAKNPYILGIGFAAFRDVASFFKNQTQDDLGTPNPIGGKVQWAIARGYSQSGSFLKSFTHLGFNQDEAGDQVFDALWPTASSRLLALNFRWALPDGISELYSLGSEGPIWWEDYPDPVRGRPAMGLLDRCRASNTCPKVIEENGSSDLWFLRTTPVWVGTDATQDIPLPDNVRRYYHSSSMHLGGSGVINASLPGVGLPAPVAACSGNNWGSGTLPANPVPQFYVASALRVALRDWVMNGTPPPPSRYPTLHDGNLVRPTKAAMGFPSIPGLPPTVPGYFINPFLDYDLGPEFNYLDVSGVPTTVPPFIKQVIPMLVPRTDADGNEIGGVPEVFRDVPLGTYLGWNVTASGFHAGQICGYSGGMIPFATTMADRLANGDPRLSLQERYGDHAGYVQAVQQAAANAVAQGFMLPADANTLITNAGLSMVLQ